MTPFEIIDLTKIDDTVSDIANDNLVAHRSRASSISSNVTPSLDGLRPETLASPPTHKNLTVRPRPPHNGNGTSSHYTVENPESGASSRSTSEQSPDSASVLSSTGKSDCSSVPPLSPVPVTPAQIHRQLVQYRSQLPQHHGMNVYSAIIVQNGSVPTIATGPDLFSVPVKRPKQCVPNPPIQHSSIRVYTTINDIESHRDVKTIVVPCTVKPVPPYKGHLVETPSNILAPYVPLTYIPHVVEIKDAEDQVRYDGFVADLNQRAFESGFQEYIGDARIERILRQEAAVSVRAALGLWLKEMALPGVTKTSLLLKRVKFNSPSTYSNWDDILGTPAMQMHLSAFENAFNEVFGGESTDSKIHVPISLEDILNFDISDPVLYPRPLNKDDDRLDKLLETHMTMQCLQCFSFSCDHGHYDQEYNHVQDSLTSMNAKFSQLRKKAIENRPHMELDKGTADMQPCDNNCFLLRGRLGKARTRKHMARDSLQMGEREEKAMVVVSGSIPKTVGRQPPSCIVSCYLERSCDLLYDFASSQKLFPTRGLFDPEPPSKAPVLYWYDRFAKTLTSNWTKKTEAGSADTIDLTPACFHDGPCSMQNCTCVQNKVFCRAACGCTVNSCSYYFTGCSCHAAGKTCMDNQKQCVCRMLQRECDPLLCVYCGVAELTDPVNRTHILSMKSIDTGCQNCDVQLGRNRKALVGKSQIPGLDGYGLMAAEDIPANSFVMEYLGEKVSQDEGIRRGARRGEGFGDGEFDGCSYLFTLLENEGIWIDAAKYGNKSRYINHGERSANLQPMVTYVIDGFRIKFVAKRDIRAGEELLFDYGGNFPNLVDLMDPCSSKRKNSQDDLEYADRGKGPSKKRKGRSAQLPVKKVRVSSKRIEEEREEERGVNVKDDEPYFDDQDDGSEYYASEYSDQP